MPLALSHGQTTLCIRRAAFERAGLTRVTLDARFSLTDDDFRVEQDLIAVGPLLGESTTDLVAELENAGLVYFDDFFELSGNWPEWLTVFVMSAAKTGR